MRTREKRNRKTVTRLGSIFVASCVYISSLFQGDSSFRVRCGLRGSAINSRGDAAAGTRTEPWHSGQLTTCLAKVSSTSNCEPQAQVNDRLMRTPASKGAHSLPAPRAKQRRLDTSFLGAESFRSNPEGEKWPPQSSTFFFYVTPGSGGIY